MHCGARSDTRMGISSGETALRTDLRGAAWVVPDPNSSLSGISICTHPTRISCMDSNRRCGTHRRRIVVPQPIASMGTGMPDNERALLSQLGPDAVLMMGDNPALPSMPKAPKLLDFFRLRFHEIAFRHLL